MFNKVLNVFLQIGSAGNWEGQKGLTPWCIMSQNAQIYFKNYLSVSDHFEALWIKGLNQKNMQMNLCNISFIAIFNEPFLLI